jgi:23S rRNA pseudouridine2605 synthase
LSNPGNTSNSDPAIPTTVQLTDARTKQWHQQGEALLTIENLRSWINAAGLVLFVPRPQIAAPAPSLVEAVLGASNPTPNVSDTSAARSLLARLVAEGLAVPLNILGATGGVVGETPDFVASTAVFSYVFTLRGDKAWKQPPATSGPVKVSNLALAIHEALSRRGALTAYDLSTEVGKEVTEAAVLRALAELWTHLRVLPLAQPDGRPTLWELTSARFTKQIKAGANAGQPSALSALISLYLGQAMAASEDEIESFLSPLAPRSRIRDVVHALLSNRQLDTLAVDGRTLVHLSGQSFSFAAETPASDSEEQSLEGADLATVTTADEVDAGDAAGRITKYVPKPRKVGTGYLAKAKPAKFGAKPDGGGFGTKPGFKRSGPNSDRERRPFSKVGSSGPRGFDKPWDEEKSARWAAAAKPSHVDEASGEGASDSKGEVTRRTYTPRPDGGAERRPRPGFGSKPRFGSKPSFGEKPPFRSEGDRRRRDFPPPPEGSGREARPARKTFSKPGTFGRKREGFGGKPAFGGESRPPRRDFPARPDRGERGSSDRPRRAEGSDFAPRKSFGPRPDRGERGSSERPRRAEGSDFAPRKSFGPRNSGGARFEGRPSSSKDRVTGKPREGQDRFTSTESGKRVYRKFDAPRDRGDRPVRTEGPGYGGRKPSREFSGRKSSAGSAGSTGRPSGGSAKKFGKPGGKKPFGKPASGFSGKPSSTFAKFAGNKKPFGNRPPARKFKPKEGESA